MQKSFIKNFAEREMITTSKELVALSSDNIKRTLIITVRDYDCEGIRRDKSYLDEDTLYSFANAEVDFPEPTGIRRTIMYFMTQPDEECSHELGNNLLRAKSTRVIYWGSLAMGKTDFNRRKLFVDGDGISIEERRGYWPTIVVPLGELPSSAPGQINPQWTARLNDLRSRAHNMIPGPYHWEVRRNDFRGAWEFHIAIESMDDYERARMVF
jgi:hypothetical protein